MKRVELLNVQEIAIERPLQLNRLVYVTCALLTILAHTGTRGEKCIRYLQIHLEIDF